MIEANYMEFQTVDNKVSCKNCGELIPRAEVCNRGRWERAHYHCVCGSYGSVKLKLISNKLPKGTVKQHVHIPWGKNKASRHNPIKKRKRK